MILSSWCLFLHFYSFQYIFLLNTNMDKRNHLLSNLKRQVIALKLQLEKIEKNKNHHHAKQSYQSRNNKSISHASRFDSNAYDCSYLDKGIKKFGKQTENISNLSLLIEKKSSIDRVPTFSSQRKNEYERTKQNFSSQRPQQSKSRSRSPNPITGEGYSGEKKGIRTCYQRKREVKERPSCKKHFNLYY